MLLKVCLNIICFNSSTANETAYLQHLASNNLGNNIKYVNKSEECVKKLTISDNSSDNAYSRYCNNNICTSVSVDIDVCNVMNLKY